ncbi:MAG: polysaccharide biosynthesis C-terminal domain-containing protein [Chitinophagaceae bacterium]|nr:polysaccharide biosynthesis C-terminal domain-containing protein [Chitinophagaceae bacterium]MBL0056689.1 polysaccharide biosynthesis C-terminal domain-containing protein [Chitinophagaceae bacterium]
MPVKRSLYQNLIWRGAYYLSVFLLNIAIARHFEAAISGRLFYICSVYSVVVMLAGLSLESGLTFFSSKNILTPGKLFNLSVIWSLFTGVACLLLAYLFFPGTILGIGQGMLILSSVCFVTGNLLTTYITGLFYSKGDFKWPNLAGTLINLLLILILIMPALVINPISSLGSLGYFHWYFISFLLTGIVLAFIYYFRYRPALFSSGLLSGSEMAGLLRYCGMAWTANILFFLLYRIDYWFVEYYCSPEQLGNYIQVSKLAQLFFVLPTILAGAVFPLTAGGQEGSVNRLLSIFSRVLFFLYGSACLFLALAGQWLFPQVFGSSFTGMYQSFLWLIPGILCLSGLFTLTAYYSGKDQIGVNIRGSLIALAVIIAGDAIFIPGYGIQAAAGVSSAGYLVYQAYVLYVFKRQYGTPVIDFFLPKWSDRLELKKLVSRSTTGHHDQQQ